MKPDRPILSLVVILLTSAVLGLLFVAAPASTACQIDGSSSPSGSPEPSPSETDDGLPIPIPLPSDEESPSPSPSPSSADRTCKAEISIAYAKAKDQFKGRVQSDEAECVKRDVMVKKVRKGPDKTVGQDLSDSQGRYKVKVPNAKGRYYAQSKKYKAEDEAGGTITCASARSKTIKV